jgi:hypothetical protein
MVVKEGDTLNFGGQAFKFHHFAAHVPHFPVLGDLSPFQSN